MRTTTTTFLAVGAAALATAMPAEAQDIQVPFAGHTTVAGQMRAHHTKLAQQRLTRKASPLARALARARHERFSARAYRRRVSDDPPAAIARRIRTLRAEIEREHRRQRRAAARRAAARWAAAARPAPAPAPAARGGGAASPTLEAIAACESGGNAAANTGNGFYGKYQFTQSTWQSVGGTGNPAAASEAEQNRRAAILYAREGASPWPVCGR
jgi:hypothetical protein